MINLPEHARCVVGSIAIELRGDRMRLVWFRFTREVDLDLDRGVAFGGKRQQTFAEAKQLNALKQKRRRARNRVSA